MRRRFLPGAQTGLPRAPDRLLAPRSDVYVGVALRDGDGHGGRAAIAPCTWRGSSPTATTARRGSRPSPHQPSMLIASGTPGSRAGLLAAGPALSAGEVETFNRRLALRAGRRSRLRGRRADPAPAGHAEPQAQPAAPGHAARAARARVATRLAELTARAARGPGSARPLRSSAAAARRAHRARSRRCSRSPPPSTCACSRAAPRTGRARCAARFTRTATRAFSSTPTAASTASARAAGAAARSSTSPGTCGGSPARRRLHRAARAPREQFDLTSAPDRSVSEGDVDRGGSRRPGFEPTPEGQQTGSRRRVKPCASRRLRRSLTGQGLTRLAGLLWPGRAQTPTARRQHEPARARLPHHASFATCVPWPSRPARRSPTRRRVRRPAARSTGWAGCRANRAAPGAAITLEASRSCTPRRSEPRRSQVSAPRATWRVSPPPACSAQGAAGACALHGQRRRAGPPRRHERRARKDH